LSDWFNIPGCSLQHARWSYNDLDVCGRMSTNTLIVSVVGMMFVLAVVVVLGAFSFSRSWNRYHHIPKEAVPEDGLEDTKEGGWPRTQ